MNPTVHPLVLSAVDWDMVCPWLRLRKCLRMAFSFRLLFCTTLHLLITTFWFMAAFHVFSPSQTVEDILRHPTRLLSSKTVRGDEIGDFMQQDAISLPFPGMENGIETEAQPSQADATPQMEETPLAMLLNAENAQGDESATTEGQDEEQDSGVEQVAIVPIMPNEIQKPLTAWSVTNCVLAVTYALFGTLWLVMTITRMSALKIACNCRSYLRTEACFALSRLPVVLGAYGTIVVTATILSLPLWLFRFLPSSLFACATIPGLIYAVFLVVFLLGCLGSLFFVPCVLMTENTDVFDALSRSYSYAVYRFPRLCFYLLVAGVIGVFGLVGMKVLIEFSTRIFTVLTACSEAQLQVVSMPRMVTQLLIMAFCWSILAWGFIYFVASIQGIYLLLRRDVDAVELDVVWQQTTPAIPAPKLPDLKKEG